MITFEQAQQLLSQESAIENQLREMTIEVVKQLGATCVENAISFEPAEYGETPCFYTQGRFGPIELFITKLWYDKDNGLMAVFKMVNDDESWEQSFDEISDRKPYSDILYFMNLGDGKIPSANGTETQTEERQGGTQHGGLIDWRSRIQK